MIEVHPGLFVGDAADEKRLRNQPDWFFIHACKEPYHRQALGYSGRAAAKDHPEYLIARRPGRLILNLVDVNDVSYIGPELVDAAIDAICENIGMSKILLHCNVGQSRSPTIAFLYLLKFSGQFDGLSVEEALVAFRRIYPLYNPARGMADYVSLNWQRYLPAA